MKSGDFLKKLSSAAAVALLIIAAFLCSCDSSDSKEQKIIDKRALHSLPYTSWSAGEQDTSKRGVTIYEKDQVYSGLNLYSVRIFSTAYLIDMQGNIIHEWHKEDSKGWNHIQLCDNGDLLVIDSQKKTLTLLDWNSDVIWEVGFKRRIHHDIKVAENGDLFVLFRSSKKKKQLFCDRKISIDYISILTPEGREKKSYNMLDLLDEAPSFFHRKKAQDTMGDNIHLNSIEILDGRLEPVSRQLFKKGNILFCTRDLNFIGIIDQESEKIIWGYGQDQLDRPHHAQLLEDGNILVFDNGMYRGFSRIIEINPLKNTIEWEYRDNPEKNFLSKTRGGVQRLPNGNTLIGESNKGRAFEINREKKIVWEYWLPQVDDKRKKRAVFYRFERIEPSIAEDIIENQKN